MEANIAKIHQQLKTEDPRTLFQYTRSSDHRVAKCCILIQPDGSLDPKVAVTSEYLINDQKSGEPFPAYIYDNFFCFSPPIPVGDGVYQTSVKGCPSRALFIHIKNPNARQEKCWVTTEIDGKSVIFLGVHTRLDIPNIGPPLLRAIQLIGLDTVEKKYVTESLPIGMYIEQLATIVKQNLWGQ